MAALAFGVAVEIELVGGGFLILAFKTHLIAASIAVYSLAAAYFHNNLADPNALTRFLRSVAIVGGLLQVMTFGGGEFSPDRLKPPRAAMKQV